MRRLFISVLAALSMLLAGTVLAAPSAAADPFCGQVWGSLEKGVPGPSAGQITGVRAAPHDCYDRLVLDIDAPLAGYDVRYVDQVIGEGSGKPLGYLAGGAYLRVVAWATTDPHSTWPWPAGRNLIDPARFQTFEQVSAVTAFGGPATTFGVGVRARLPFRVFVLQGPGDGSRLVVDVGHYW